VKFNRRARLDTSQVSDRRRMRAGPAAVGGVGGLGIIGVLLFLFLGGGGGGLDSVLGGLDGVAVDGAQQGPSEVEQECRSGADAEQRQDCRIVAVVNSVQAYWEETLSTT
jgi:uncharacterized protein